MNKPKPKISLRKVFNDIVWPRRKLILLGLVLIIIRTASGLVTPAASKYLVDDVFGQNNLDLLKDLIVVVSIAITIQAFTSYWLTQLLSVEAQHLISELRVKVQRHLIKLPIRFFDNQKSGALVSRVMNDVEGVRNIVGTGLVQLIGGVLAAVVTLILMFSISWVMTLIVLLPIGIFGLISMKAFGKIRPIFRERGRITSEVTGRLTETLGGIRVIKGFGAEEQETHVFEKGVNQIFQNIKTSLTTTSFVTSSATLLMGIATVGIMAYGGYAISGKSLTSGEFFQFFFYIAFLVAPIIQMSNIGTQLTEAFAGLDRTEELLNEPLEDQDNRRTITLAEVHGDIRFDNVSFEYEPGKPVIQNITFNAPSGSVTALVGTSGSGKTTIAGLAASFLNPLSGNITIDGIDQSTIKLGEFRQHLGVVLQDDFLFEGTIRENIMFPRPNATQTELDAAVQAAYVNEFTDRFEAGLDTVIGERGVKLSGGQRQRLAIARAILANPKILILDEATSSLDTESEAFIQQSLKKLMEGRTTFVIAHRLSTIRQADQILVIEEGHIRERGTHDELIESKGRYYELYTYQARI